MISQVSRHHYAIIVFFLLFSSCFTNKTPEEYYQNGLQLIKDGKKSTGYKLIKKAVQKAPKNLKYLSAAADFAPNQSESYIHTKALWDNNLRDTTMLFRLTSLAFHTTVEQKLQYALQRFNELPDSLKTDEFKGEIFFQFNMFDSSLALWREAEKNKPSAQLSNKIATCFQYIGNLDSMLVYLKTCRDRNLLNSTDYATLISLWAINYDFVQAEKMYKESVRKGFCDMATAYEYAAILLFKEDVKEAEKKLTELVALKTDTGNVNDRVATMLGYLYYIQGDKKRLSNLITEKKTAVKLEKPVVEFLEILGTITEDTVAVLEKLTSISHLFTHDPVYQLIYARQLTATKRLAEADSVYRRLPLAILYSPVIAPEYSSVSLQLGRVENAFQMISRMHEKKIMNKKSLELYRDITIKLKLFEMSIVAQKQLQMLYRDDISVRLGGVVLALAMGKADSAITIIEKQLKKYPDENQFRVLKLSVLYSKGDYKQLIKECESGTFSLPFGSLLKARAYRKLGTKNAAISAYKDAIFHTKKDTSDLYLEYGEYLLECKKYKEAVSIYSELLNFYKNKEIKDTLILAMVQNNYAWAGLQCDSIYPQYIEASKNACELVPNKAELADTYASILLKTGNYKHCTAFLRNNSTTFCEPQLLYHLAQSYEKSGDRSHAIRTYQKIIDMADSIGTVPVQFSKNKIREHIYKLK